MSTHEEFFNKDRNMKKIVLLITFPLFLGLTPKSERIKGNYGISAGSANSPYSDEGSNKSIMGKTKIDEREEERMDQKEPLMLKKEKLKKELP
jgi:hypothetical protein